MLLDPRRLQLAVAKIRSWNKARLRRHRDHAKEDSRDGRDPLCVMTIVKNESLNIREWIDHHFWQGAAHLFIIDNGSTDDTLRLIETHPRISDMSIFRLPRPYRQAEHYRYVYKTARIRSRFKWLLIADADEFWFDKAGKGLLDALRSLDDFDLVYCNWTIFGTAGHDAHPASLRTELTTCQPTLGPHQLTKWVAKTDAIKRPSAIGIHKVSDCKSTHTISDNERLQINHYFTQSRQYWTEVKMRRGDAFDPANDTARNMRMFEQTEAGCTVKDDRLASLLRDVRQP